MTKKSKRSALFYFALDCKQKRGLKGPIPEVIGLIHSEWKNMSDEEKKTYEDQYQRWVNTECNNNTNSSQNNVLNNNNNNTSQAFIRLEREKSNLKDLDIYIKEKLRNSLDLIKKHSWHFIKFQSFCKTDGSINPYRTNTYDSYYVLAEVAIIEYSILKGIKRKYHAFIEPNIIPTGYQRICGENSTRTHQIPISDRQDFTYQKSSHEQIYLDINDFIKSSDEFMGFFCREEDYAETKFGLEFLRDRFTEYQNSQTKIDKKIKPFEANLLNLECLVMKLSNVDSISQAFALLNRLSYDHSPNTNCDFHIEKDRDDCSLGFVKRYSYLISDALCHIYSVELTPNHLPIIKNSSSNKRICSNYDESGENNYNQETQKKLRY